MKITKEWLAEKDACSRGIEWFCSQNETDAIKLIENAIEKQKHIDWANWLIVRLMTHKQQIQYAVYAAEQVIDIFEKEYPEDKRPRAAIEAAKKCIDNPSAGNKAAARAAARAADAVAADAAAARAADAADATYAAIYAAAAAAYAAYAYAASAAYAADAVNAAILTKCLKYGLELLKEGEE